MEEGGGDVAEAGGEGAGEGGEAAGNADFAVVEGGQINCGIERLLIADC